MGRFSKIAVSVGASIGLLLAGVSPASASQSETQSEAEIEYGQIKLNDSGHQSRAVGCTPWQKVDQAHISTMSSNHAAQSHGAWFKGDCEKEFAKVTVQLDRINWLGLFVAIGQKGVGVVPSTPKKSGIPTGKYRVIAHYDCKGTGEAKFRSWIDVDVIDLLDLPDKLYSTEKSLKCG